MTRSILESLWQTWRCYRGGHANPAELKAADDRDRHAARVIAQCVEAVGNDEPIHIDAEAVWPPGYNADLVGKVAP